MTLSINGDSAGATNAMDQPAKYLAFLGESVHVVIDRPIGSRHPRLGFAYETNYGHVPGTVAGDGEEIDAYVLGVSEPVSEYTGTCVAVILRHDDAEHKLIVGPCPMSAAAIARDVAFVERHFETEIVLFGS